MGQSGFVVAQFSTSARCAVTPASTATAFAEGATGRTNGDSARRPSDHDHRSGTGYRALSRRCGAGRRQPDRRRRSLFPAVRADPHIPEDRGCAPLRGGQGRRSRRMVVARGRSDGAKAIQEGGAASASDDSEHDTADAWDRARLFASTVEDHELLDPTLTPERLLYRLFNEERVRVFPSTPLAPLCQCSTERVHDMLAAMSPDERADVAQDGRIHVTCEFCNRRYEFGAADFGGRLGGLMPPPTARYRASLQARRTWRRPRADRARATSTG